VEHVKEISKPPKMFTEGNEFNDQQVIRIDTNDNDSTNLIKNNHLDTEFEPAGS